MLRTAAESWYAQANRLRRGSATHQPMNRRNAATAGATHECFSTRTVRSSSLKLPECSARGKLLADGAAMLVITRCSAADRAPSSRVSTPDSEVRVFQIERTKQVIESAKLEKLPAVERAGTAAAIEAWICIRDAVVDPMSDAQCSARPPGLRESGFFTQLRGSLKKIWQETAKTFSSVKPSSSGCRKSGVHPHVAVQQHDDVVLRRAETRHLIHRRSQDFVAEPALGRRGNCCERNPHCHRIEPLSTTIISLPGWRLIAGDN